MSLQEAAQQALEALENDPVLENAKNNATAWLRAALTEDVPETNFGNMAQEVDCYGDGNVYRGQRSSDSQTQTLTINGMPAVEGPLSKAHRTCQESRHVEPVAYVTGYSKGYATVRPVDPCLLMPVGMALYRLPPTINEMETVELATDDCLGCLRLEDQLYDALGRLQIANLKLAGGAAIKITERKVAEWLQKEYSTDTEGTSTIKDNLIVEPVGYGVFEDGNLHDSFRLEHEAKLFAAFKGEHAEVKALYAAPTKRELLKDCGEAGHNEGRCGNSSCITPIKREPVATSQESRQVEPVAWLQIGVGDHEGTVIATTTKPKTWNPAWWRFEPLYTAPPKREPLNTDLILARWANECVPNRSTPELVVAFTRAIEQAHGIGGEE